jgi:hypothetical protein
LFGLKNLVSEEYCGSWGSFTHSNQLTKEIEKLREEYLQLQWGGTSISLAALAEMEVKWVLPPVD